jgi:tRNA pseudouridine13 synthase
MPLPDWARAYASVPPDGISAPLIAATIRTTPSDFDVTEELGYAFDGEGEHDFLFVEKIATNTEWLSRQLAGFAGVPAKDVGYSGLKDRNAVTRQWFSVPRWNSPDWTSVSIEGAKVLETQRHSKKLRRGAHKANHFKIVLRPSKQGTEPFCLQTGSDPISEKLRLISEQGVPNYYGEQRLGREGEIVRLADDWAAGKRLPRHKRSIAISSARSFLFNEYLHERVLDGTWNRILPGDLANLDGTGSVFSVDEVDGDITRRCNEMDLHPAAELAGDGSRSRQAGSSSRQAGPRSRQAGSRSGHESWQRAFDKGRVKPGSRSLRLNVRDLRADVGPEQVELIFTLGRGAFATSVLREIVR